MAKSDEERAAWRPAIVPGIGRQLSPAQELSCAFRILAAGGFSENILGHIAWDRDSDGRMLVNPWGKWWDELCSSDICTVDVHGHGVDGRWDVTPAIHILG